MKCNYPACESENLNYYKQYDSKLLNNLEKKYEKLLSISKLIKGGVIKLNYLNHKYKYELKAVSDVKLNSKLIKLLLNNNFDINKLYKVTKLTFYNSKLYSGVSLYLIYKIENGILRIYGAIDSNENIQKFEDPKEFNLNLKYNLGKQIASLMGCNDDDDCKVKVDGNHILIYKQKSYNKTYKKWGIKLNLSWGKKTKIKPIGEIILGPNTGIIKNKKGQIIGRIEIYGDDYVILNIRGQIVSEIKNEYIHLRFKHLKMNLKLKLNNYNY